MQRKTLVIVVGVASTSLISGYLLWNYLIGGTVFRDLGLPGIFLASLLSHATMVARDLFVPLFLALAGTSNPVLLGVAAGVGGAIGDLVPYALGIGLADTVRGSSRAEDTVTRWINKYGMWAILAVAMTPLPDMPVIMLAGTRRLPFGRLVAIEAVGKTVLYSVGAFFGGAIFEVLIGAVGGVTAQIIVVAGSIAACVILTWPPSRDYIFGLFERLIPTGGG